ncbi:MAG TPA: GGDEF domain-containing protein [Rhizomicrobium sp.]|jgi:diguanylate cyclase (GGDEF)-like protein|nr:GGDEF domain-containing protein [Rhizomicrobium sp.]
MKVERNSAARGTRSVAQAAYARRVEAVAGPASPETVAPSGNILAASVLGIPEAEFTPKVRDAIMGLMNEVENLRRELHQTKIRLEDMEKAADQDGMLPLLNRRAFVRELTRYIGMAGRYNMPVSLIYFDLNHLKKTNDTYGHAAGDAVLEHFAGVLSKNVRESDVVGRLGGDEFGVLLSHANQTQALKKADSLAATLQASPTKWEGHTIPVSFAYGAFELSSGDRPDVAMARADQAMYAHKKAQRSAAE